MAEPVPLAIVSPLGGRTQDAPASHRAAGFELRELRAVAAVRLQTLRGDAERVATAAANVLPASPNGVAGDDPWVLWRAPGDWLAYSLTLPEEQIESTLRQRLSDVPLLFAGVSAASVVFELGGARAVDVLLRDCTLDLEGDAVPIGACAHTALAQLSVTLHQPAAGLWRLWADRSAARYLWDWLVDTAGPAVTASPDAATR